MTVEGAQGAALRAACTDNAPCLPGAETCEDSRSTLGALRATMGHRVVTARAKIAPASLRTSGRKEEIFKIAVGNCGAVGASELWSGRQSANAAYYGIATMT